MRTRYFILFVLLGMVIEYFLRSLFVGHSVIIVPELIIFLTILNLDNESILAKFVTSAVLYDFWVSSPFGTVIVSMLMTFLVLYFVGRISYVGAKKTRKGFLVNVLALTIFSDFLFLIYYISNYFLTSILLGFHSEQISWSWKLPVLTSAIQVSLVASIVFLVFYALHGLITRPGKFKV